MEPFKDLSNRYFETLTDRAKKSKVYKPFQLVGLTVAQLLDDDRHRSLYIKLAQKHKHDYLLQLAKRIAESKNIVNKGAYFMRVFYGSKK